MRAPVDRAVQKIRVEDIFIVGHRRDIREQAVKELMESIEQQGLHHPISVRFVDYLNDPDEGELHGAYVLVAGRHRLEAYRRLGRQHIECVLMECTEDEARLWEIAENLKRAELTALERSEHVAEWIRLTEKLSGATCATKPGRGQGATGGVRAASRELGIERTQAQRAVKIDSITPEAKEVAKKEGLSISQRALLTIAKAPPEKQAEVARRYKLAPEPVDDEQATETQLAALMNAWNRAGSDARRMFLERVA